MVWHYCTRMTKPCFLREIVCPRGAILNTKLFDYEKRIREYERNNSYTVFKQKTVKNTIY